MYKLASLGGACFFKNVLTRIKMNDVYKHKCFLEEDLLAYKAFFAVTLMAATTAMAFEDKQKLVTQAIQEDQWLRSSTVDCLR